ncbi:hypothetical protein Tco_0594110 [Tanacetum coccineum]
MSTGQDQDEGQTNWKPNRLLHLYLWHILEINEVLILEVIINRLNHGARSQVDDCPKAHKRVVNKVDKGMGGSFGADDEGVSPKTTPSVGKKNDVDSGNKASSSGVQKEGQSYTPLVEKINNEDEVLPVDNEMASFLSSKPLGVGYGTNSLLKQWRDTYGNADYDYDPYDDDIYEGQEIHYNIQSICDNLDIKVRSHKKK